MYGKNSSILDDIRYQFSHGSMVNKLLLVNLFAFVAILIVKIALNAFGAEPFEVFMNYIGVGHTWHTLLRPWTLFTYMFAHLGFFHILFNLIALYVFGFAFNTFFNDKQMLAVYIYGGLAGAIAYIVFANLIPAWSFGSYMIGASASVMAVLLAATVISPNYEIRLFILGSVKLKYIALAFLLFDLVGLAAMANTGGHIAHIGGAFMGFFYVKQLQNGRDLALPFNRLMDKISNLFRPTKKGPKVVYRRRSPRKVYTTKEGTPTTTDTAAPVGNNINSPEIQERINVILDKIGEKGYDSLSKEEKSFLFRFKKKD